MVHIEINNFSATGTIIVDDSFQRDLSYMENVRRNFILKMTHFR